MGSQARILMMEDYDFADLLVQADDEIDAVYKNSLATVCILLDRMTKRGWRKEFQRVSFVVFASIYGDDLQEALSNKNSVL
jgi:hypothetical protein